MILKSYQTTNATFVCSLHGLTDQERRQKKANFHKIKAQC